MLTGGGRRCVCQWSEGDFDRPQPRRQARSSRRIATGDTAGPAWRKSARPAGMIWRTEQAQSGWQLQCPQSRQGAAELILPGPALGKMQGETACLAGDASREGEEASAQGLGGRHRLVQTDARGPASQIVSDDLYGQPGGVGGKVSRGVVVEAHTVLEIADGVLDLGVAAMVGLQFQGVALPVRDEGVIAVISEERQLGAGRGGLSRVS